MKRCYIISLLPLLMLSFICSGQNDSIFWNEDMIEIAKPYSAKGWVHLKESKDIEPLALFDVHKPAFLLGEADEMSLLKQENDEFGFTIYRFQQLYKGLIVEGGEQIVHSKNGMAVRAIGKIITRLDMDTNSVTLPSEATEKAIAHISADKYLWEELESDLTDEIIDSIVYSYPTAELLFTRTDNSLPLTADNFILAYRVKVIAISPASEHYLYVDAKSGDLFKKSSLITKYHCNCCNGTASIMYINDTKSITTRHRGLPIIANNYFLKDNCRGDYIQTFKNSSNVTDPNNDWTDDDDQPAYSAHWAAGMTYDYFLNKHNRNSFDGNGKRLILNTNVSFVDLAGNTTYNGAEWSPTHDLASFGRGDGSTADHFVSLDVVAHEITHGITHYTASLGKTGEPGALSESFSDIFGKMVEFNNKTFGASWEVAEDVYFSGALRSMSNPKSYNDPDTYEGDDWDFQGGSIHKNAGVQNFWFYLLAAGDNGENDNGENYNVTGIGRNKAAAIAYRNLTSYLWSSAEYSDARNGSIYAAIDLFGECSQEVISTIEAWNAVGVSGQGGRDFNFTDPCFSGPFGLPWTHYPFRRIINNFESNCDLKTLAAQATFVAGNRVHLKPGFRSSTIFRAHIDPCMQNNKKEAPYYTFYANNDPKPEAQLEEIHAHDTIPSSFHIEVYPNPVHSTGQIRYTLPRSSTLTLTVYNLQGKVVDRLLADKYHESGAYHQQLDANQLPPGVYYFSLQSADFKKTRKFVVIR